MAAANKALSLAEKLSYLTPDSPPDARTLRIAVLGPTSVGKSSLVNMLSAYRSCAVSQKINTTRSKQAVITTRGNTQLVFVDLPGLLSEQRRRKFNLENFIMRDVHSCVFSADLVLVVADASHVPSRTRIDEEVLKALHYFHDKPSVLVVNKIDRLGGSRVKLLDMVRQLTDGVVAGRVSHVDCYAGRILEIDRRVQLLLEQQQQRQQQQQQVCDTDWHGRWDRRLERHLVPPMEQLQSHLLPPPDVTMWGPAAPAPTPLLTDTDRRLLLQQQQLDEEEEEDSRQLLAPTVEASDAGVASSRPRQLKTSQLEPFSLFLRDQLLLGSVTKEEALARRRRWREIGARIQGQVAWRGFQEAFLVSAATGEGIDNLRDFLFSIASPGRWLFHSSCLSDMEPSDLIKMCVWARCLDSLPDEVPYQLRFELEDLERSPDGRLFVSLRILCPTTRALTLLIGQHGASIHEIARRAKLELQDTFRANVTLKLAAARATVPGRQLRRIRSAKLLSQLFPDSVH